MAPFVLYLLHYLAEVWGGEIQLERKSYLTIIDMTSLELSRPIYPLSLALLLSSSSHCSVIVKLLPLMSSLFRIRVQSRSHRIVGSTIVCRPSVLPSGISYLSYQVDRRVHDPKQGVSKQGVSKQGASTRSSKGVQARCVDSKQAIVQGVPRGHPTFSDPTSRYHKKRTNAQSINLSKRRKTTAATR